MKALSTIFSFLCSQDVSRSFGIEGLLLPLCQRCTGVYVGMGISFVWLLANRYYKKGLPPRSVIYVNIASLAIMPIFGFHLLDPGPGWRLWSSLIFGNAVTFLILPGSSLICNEGKAAKGYTRLSTLSFFVVFIFLNTISLWFPIQSSYFYYTILTLILIGLLCVPFCIVSVLTFLAKKTLALLILKGFRNGYARNCESLLS